MLAVRATFLAFALLAAGLAGCATPEAATTDADVPIRVTLAIQPTDNADAIMDKATELEQFLEARMRDRGVEADIVIRVPLSYAGVVESLRFGHADAALMGAWPAVMATRKAGAEIVLAEMREVAHGDEAVVAPYYYSYYVVRADSPYQTLADLRGKMVAFPSSTSTSGYVFPLAKLVDDGLIPPPANGAEADVHAFFGAVRFAGGYVQAWEALKNGQVDVAVIAGDVNAKLYDEVLANTRVLSEQGPIPSHAVVFSKEFNGPARDALKAALLDLKDERRDLMRKLVSGIFVEFTETTTETHAEGLTRALDLSGLRFGEKL